MPGYMGLKNIWYLLVSPIMTFIKTCLLGYWQQGRNLDLLRYLRPFLGPMKKYIIKMFPSKKLQARDILTQAFPKEMKDDRRSYKSYKFKSIDLRSRQIHIDYTIGTNTNYK